jgi:ribosome-associated translation inhibitor RaiA
MIEKLKNLMALTEEQEQLKREIEQSLYCNKFTFAVHAHFSDRKIRVSAWTNDNFNAANLALFRLEGSEWAPQKSGDYFDNIDEMLHILNGAMS